MNQDITNIVIEDTDEDDTIKSPDKKSRDADTSLEAKLEMRLDSPDLYTH
jgi:hypothetical protein